MSRYTRLARTHVGLEFSYPYVKNPLSSTNDHNHLNLLTFTSQSVSNRVMCKVCLTASNTIFDANAKSLNYIKHLASEIFWFSRLIKRN